VYKVIMHISGNLIGASPELLVCLWNQPRRNIAIMPEQLNQY